MQEATIQQASTVRTYSRTEAIETVKAMIDLMRLEASEYHVGEFLKDHPWAARFFDDSFSGKSSRLLAKATGPENLLLDAPNPFNEWRGQFAVESLYIELKAFFEIEGVPITRMYAEFEKLEDGSYRFIG